MHWGLALICGVALLTPLGPSAAMGAPPTMLEPVAPATVAGAWPRPTLDSDPRTPLPASADGELQLHFSASQGVSGRVFVLDTSRRRLVGFGGRNLSTQGLNLEVWALSLTGGGWSRLLAGGAGEVAPAGREYHVMTYDPVRDRVILFSGMAASGALTNDVWALSLSGTPHWEPLTTNGTPPVPRRGATGIYDPVRDRIVYFGGFDGQPNDLYSSEIWELSLASSPPVWTLRSAQGPYPQFRADHFAAYDATRDRMLMYGPGSNVTPLDAQVWELQFSPTLAWHVIPSSTPGPSATSSPRMVLDASRDRLLLLRDDLWEFTLSPDPHWTQLLPNAPSPFSYQARAVTPVIDAVGDRVVRALSPTAYQWDLAGPPAWTILTGVPVAPFERQSNAVAADGQGRMWIFGGLTYAWNGTADMGDLWALDLHDPLTWSPIVTPGPAPSPRRGAGLVYDAAGNRMLMFGGASGVATVLHNDLWALTVGETPSWTLLSPAGPLPPPRVPSALVYDPVGTRLVMYGGGRTTSPPFADLWELSLASDPPVWSQPSAPCPCPRPPDYLPPRAVYDPVRHRVLVYLSYTDGSPDQLWELGLQPTYSWTQLAPTGTRPHLDSPHMAYEPQRDRIILSSLRLWWELALGTTPPAWTQLFPAGPEFYYVPDGVVDAPGDRLVLFGGGEQHAETWTLNWGSPLGAPPAPRSVATILEPCRPNPASDRVTFGYTLPAAAPVLLEVLDVTGRRLATLVDAVVPAGRHEVRWDLATASRPRVAPGVYLYRLRSAGVERVRRLVALE